MCVLVVEDDALIRAILVEELEDAGYEVRQAETGDLAIAALQTIDPALSVLVTDIHMPGTSSGLDLAVHVRRLFPQVPIIITTGRPDAMDGVPDLGTSHCLIRKPYIAEEVIGMIRALHGVSRNAAG